MYSKECVETFLKQQGQLFDEPVAETYEEAEEFLEECIAVVVKNIKEVKEYLDEPWDYVITVCGGANETCPIFIGKVGKRIHIGFDDPSNVVGSKEHVISEFRRVRDDIRKAFRNFYATYVK